MSIEKINYKTYIENIINTKLSLDYQSFKDNLIQSLGLEEDDIDLNKIFLLENKNFNIFISDEFIYLPIKIKYYLDDIKDTISKLTLEDHYIEKKIHFKILSYDIEENLDELSQLIYMNYFLSKEELEEIYADINLHSEKIKSFIKNNELHFIYISLDNLTFKFDSEIEKKDITKWLHTLILQISEQLSLNITFFKKGDNTNNIKRCFLKNIYDINSEIIYDTISLQYLNRAQKFYQDSPHISFLEYYHILERFMKEHRFNIFIENYKNVYNILLSNDTDITKKTKVINTISTLDKKFSEVIALEKLLDNIIQVDTFSILINYKTIGHNHTKYKEYLKENAPFWDKDDDFKITNDESFKKKIAKRLYATRNSIVHSKSFDGEDTFDIDNKEHLEYLNVDLFILKYLVINFLNHISKRNMPLNHFFSFNSLLNS